MRRQRLLLVFGGLLAAAGCGGRSPAAVGTETGPCYASHKCDDGLACVSDVCVPGVLDGGATDAGGTPDAGGDAGAFEPAPHPRLPRVVTYGGPVLAAPRVQPIVYASDGDAATINRFLGELAASSYWSETTAEYGVGALQVLPPITITSPPPTSLSNDDLEGQLASNTAGPGAPWGQGDPGTIYLFLIPQGPVVTLFGSSTSCQDFDGFHYEAAGSAATLPYAVACACPTGTGNGLSMLQERTLAISHELIEAATDPFPSSNPAYGGQDLADYVWTFVTGGEVADLCALNPDIAATLPGSGFVVQRSWSNAAAAKAQNPCVPAPAGPYFNSFPALDAIEFPYNGGRFATQGLLVPLGKSKTIDVTLFSAGPTANNWSVTAFAYEDLFGGDRSNLALSLDSAAGRNGDRLHLTLTPRKANPAFGGEVFILLSQYGHVGDPDYQTNLSMGLIGN